MSAGTRRSQSSCPRLPTRFASTTCREVSEHAHEALTTAAKREMLRATRVMLRTRTHARARTRTHSRVHAHRTHVVWRTEAGFSLVAIL